MIHQAASPLVTSPPWPRSAPDARRWRPWPRCAAWTPPPGPAGASGPGEGPEKAGEEVRKNVGNRGKMRENAGKRVEN